jgi:isoquinoline 1-oxidoreductase alpha subunit
MTKYEFHANGKPVSVEADSHYPLLWALRDDLKLTGTKFGSLIVYGAVGNAVSRASGVKQYSYPIKALNLIPSPNP